MNNKTTLTRGQRSEHRVETDALAGQPSSGINASPARAADRSHVLTRRDFLATSGLATGGLLLGQTGLAGESQPRSAARPGQALVALSLHLEMSANFPQWEDTHWNYEKGNLNEETKRYVVEAARRVKARGGVIHFFALGQTFEQENVEWLREIVQAGHPVGTHTYDHINVLATSLDAIQARFKRSPWLIAGKTPAEVVRENIRLANAALKSRIGIDPAGFRTPGGFPNGLNGRPDVQQMLLDFGFDWISSKYPAHPIGAPTPELYDAIVKAQVGAQPFVYPTGLIEVPQSPISDIGAFRNGRWKLEEFLTATRLSVEWAIQERAVFAFLSHPSVLYVKDPEFRAIDMICDLVEKAGAQASIVDFKTIARRAKEQMPRR